MVFRRMTSAFALVGLVLVATATPAFAHAELKSSNPAKGASLDAAPKQIQLTFSEPVSPEAITVAGPDGAQWTVGQVVVEGPVVTAPVQPTGPAGPYTINYRVLSSDGDPVTGTVAFTMAVAAAPATTTTTPPTTTTGTTGTDAPPTSSTQAAAPAANEDGGGVPGWVWVLVAIAALLVVGAIVGRRFQDRASKE